MDYIRDLSPERESKFRRVIKHRQKSLTVVLENVHDPHNISAILRSCDAVGILGVHIINTQDAKPVKLGRKSSASARKWIEVTYHASVENCYNMLREAGIKIWATHLGQQSKSLYEINLAEPVALVFGNEHLGVSEEAATNADGNFLIPMMGMIQSLNVSVACAVSLYEALRQRIETGFFEKSDLTEAEQQALYHDWSHR